MVFLLSSFSFLHDICPFLYFLFCGLDKLQCYFGLGLEAHADLFSWPFPVRLITTFDCKVVMKWEGTGDGTAVEGTLTIPEAQGVARNHLRPSEFVISISGAPMLVNKLRRM